MSLWNIRHKKILFTSFKIVLLVFYFLFFFALISLIIPPHFFWISGASVLFIPFFLFINFILLVFFLIYKSEVKWISITFFILSSYYFYLLFRIPHKSNDISYDFKLLSYNVSGYRITGNKELKSSLANYIIGQESDIVCLQEYYIDSWPFLDSLYPYQIVETGKKSIGVAIFSKHPIVSKGIVFEGESSFNKGIFADIVVKGKTIRVITVHLESNGLQRGNPFLPLQKIVYNIEAFKNTSGVRSLQACKLRDFISTSKYPVIVAGDFNETPYSYVYLTMRKELNNSFEEKGSGFGFTFLSEKAKLRIDHHFASDSLRVEDYSTYQEVKLSDHAPVVGTYSFTN